MINRRIINIVKGPTVFKADAKHKKKKAVKQPTKKGNNNAKI